MSNLSTIFTGFSSFRAKAAPAAAPAPAAIAAPVDLSEHLLTVAADDRHALAALAAYARSCEHETPVRAQAIRTAVIARTLQNHHMVTVPATQVGGEMVPAFRVGQYLCGRGAFDTPQIDPWTAPWTAISYLAAKRLCDDAGLSLLTERQALAIAYNILAQAVNWSGGGVGHGRLYQGLHKGLRDGPQAATHRSTCLSERRWHVLSNGEIIHDMAGNAYCWIFDDVQGERNGIVARPFSTNSPSVERAEPGPYASGMGDGPSAGDDYSGNALIRGGHWCSGDVAGIFHLRAHPADRAEPEIGFRIAAPI